MTAPLAISTDDAEVVVEAMANTLIDLGMTRGSRLDHAKALLNAGWPAAEVLKHGAAVEVRLAQRKATTARVLASIGGRHG